MKRLLLNLVVILTIFNCFSQNSIWIEQSKDNTLLVFEYNDATDSVFNYLYTESDITNNLTNSTYILASRDQKWWNNPIWMHTELRTFVSKDFLSNNIYLIGPMFEIMNNKLGFINVQTLYRYDGINNFQVTLLSEISYKRFTYSMYIDNYGFDKWYMHSENRLFMKINKTIQIGGNMLVTVNETTKLNSISMAVLKMKL